MISLFPIVFATLQLLVSLEPIDLYSMVSVVKGTFANDVYSQSEK